jgi:hypothetical protein
MSKTAGVEFQISPLAAPDFPPAMVELAIPVRGTKMNGHIYLAKGPGPHSTVLLLHGYPGNERSLDLAQFLRRGGVNVLFFHYRGSWGSGGLFSWNNSIEDVIAAIQFLRSESGRFRVDTERIVLMGHSLGAWLSLRVAAMYPGVCGAAAMGLENIGADAKLYRTDSMERNAWLAYLDATVGEGRPIRARSAEYLLQEMLQYGEGFDLLGDVPALRDRPVLMIGATRDYELPVEEHQHPLAAALIEAGSRSVENIVLEADHSFSGCREELCRIVRDWLENNVIRHAERG